MCRIAGDEESYEEGNVKWEMGVGRSKTNSERIYGVALGRVADVSGT